MNGLSALDRVRGGADCAAAGFVHAHLHYMIQHRNISVCPFEYSSDAAKAEFQAIADRSGTRPCY